MVDPDNFNNLFNPDRSYSKGAMKRTWIEFRDDLINSDCEYDDTERALESTFLKQFDNLFKNEGIKKLPVSLLECFEKSFVGRGAVLKINEKLSYSRFIPDKQYITQDNRFSPPGIEWLYLAIGNSDKLIKKCAEKECKAKFNDRFGFCNFELLSPHKDFQIIDLTVADSMEYVNIDDKIQKLRIKHFNSASKNKFQQAKEIEYEEKECRSWILLTYCKIMSEMIFEPVENANKTIAYKPFQTLAKYFEKQGYVGIKYKSTVFDGANNIVIFDKSFAQPCGEILDYYVSD